uniref:Uncharacterized protein n=1 Tax=Panagrolaimus sp. JU765 TaxID=591449 RepID=A0AC34R3R1_9BILA
MNGWENPEVERLLLTKLETGFPSSEVLAGQISGILGKTVDVSLVRRRIVKLQNQMMNRNFGNSFAGPSNSKPIQQPFSKSVNWNHQNHVFQQQVSITNVNIVQNFNVEPNNFQQNPQNHQNYWNRQQSNHQPVQQPYYYFPEPVQNPPSNGYGNYPACYPQVPPPNYWPSVPVVPNANIHWSYQKFAQRTCNYFSQDFYQSIPSAGAQPRPSIQPGIKPRW